jgi:2'-5' RNA ligase
MAEGSGSGQREVPGVAPPPRPTDRLFFAAHPDAEAARHIDRLAQRLHDELQLSGKPLGVARYHVTLIFLGDFVGMPQPLIDGLRRLAAQVALAPFQVVFDRVESFRKRRDRAPVVLLGDDGADGLLDLREAIGRPFEEAGLMRLSQAFTPHLTLLYEARRVEALPIAPITWTVREFSLVHSLIGHGRHTVLDRWPLRG